LSLVGAVTVCRAYYYCRSCGLGFGPFDQTAGLTDRHLTPAVERRATLAGGVADSFDQGAELLEEMAGVRLSAATVARTTEDVGARLATAQAAGQTFGPAVDWDWQRDAQGRTTAYVAIDATGVRQQGAHGTAAAGRMA
jgi:hypothetical protein